jgi:hypothetical protein
MSIRRGKSRPYKQINVYALLSQQHAPTEGASGSLELQWRTLCLDVNRFNIQDKAHETKLQL